MLAVLPGTSPTPPGADWRAVDAPDAALPAALNAGNPHHTTRTRCSEPTAQQVKRGQHCLGHASNLRQNRPASQPRGIRRTQFGYCVSRSRLHDGPHPTRGVGSLRRIRTRVHRMVIEDLSRRLARRRWQHRDEAVGFRWTLPCGWGSAGSRLGARDGAVPRRGALNCAQLRRTAPTALQVVAFGQVEWAAAS